MIRAFIAVELAEPLRRKVADLQSDLQAAGADVKWVEPANLHLTLKFLGNIEEGQVDPLIEALKTAVASLTGFPFTLEGIGAFPGTTRPRVIWVGTGRGEQELIRLAQAVENGCAGLGFPAEERSFRPHLTIGRVRGRERLAGLIRKLQTVKFAGGQATAERLTLFQSTLSPHGPSYSRLAEIPLG